MKTLQRRIDNISGFELTKEEKALLKGGDEIPCNFMCQVYDSEGDIGDPDCCPYESVAQCEYEFNWYNLQQQTGLAARCWGVSG